MGYLGLLVFEAKVGKGSLLITGVNLKDNLDKRPVAWQFLYSLNEYVNGSKFSPSEAVTSEMIDTIFKK